MNKSMRVLIKYAILDLIRNKIIFAYFAFLFLVSFLMFSLEDDGSKAVLGLLSIILLLSPLVCMVFTAIQYYNNAEFNELILTQPISRKSVISSEYIAISFMLTITLITGIGLPAIMFGKFYVISWLLFCSIPLTFVCTSIALWLTINIRDKAKGIGAVLLVWFYLNVVYDGIVMISLLSLSDYPLEKWSLFLMSLNPVDLCRVAILLKIDASALLGYTGTLFKNLFVGQTGITLIFAILVVWIIIPLHSATKNFLKKDF